MKDYNMFQNYFCFGLYQSFNFFTWDVGPSARWPKSRWVNGGCQRWADVGMLSGIMGELSSIVLLSLHKCDKITCTYWCFTPLYLCCHIEIPSAPMTTGDYSVWINFMIWGLNLRRSTTIPCALHASTYIAEYALCVCRYAKLQMQSHSQSVLFSKDKKTLIVFM